MREDVPMPLELWGSGEIVAHCGISHVTFRRWRDSGRFPDPLGVVNRGRTAVWDADDVRAWYEKHRKRLAELRGS
jgi:predicted DNA-binding transcriptional regulator AlpA